MSKDLPIRGRLMKNEVLLSNLDFEDVHAGISFQTWYTHIVLTSCLTPLFDIRQFPNPPKFDYHVKLPEDYY